MQTDAESSPSSASSDEKFDMFDVGYPKSGDLPVPHEPKESPTDTQMPSETHAQRLRRECATMGEMRFTTGKHMNKMYKNVYTDSLYVKWCLPRRLHSEELLNFTDYIMLRRRLEEL